MKTARTLISLAALACSAPTMAQDGSVQLYGTVAAAMVYKNHQVGGSLKELSNSPLAMSYFGLRGTEPLGGGLAAVFRLESPLNTDTGNAGSTVGASSKFWGRQSYVGLEVGRHATFTLGRQFHAATDRVIRSLDVQNVAGTTLHTTPLALFGVNRFVGNDSRVDDSAKLRITGPAGLQGGVSVGANDGAGRSWSADLAQLSPTYTVAAWAAQFNSPTVVAATGQRPQQSLWGVGGNLTLGPVRLYGHWVDSTLEPSAANRLNQRNQLLHLGANWQASGALVAKLAWYGDKGRALNGVAARDGRKTTVVASGEYFLSKRSSLHVAAFSNRFSGGYVQEALNLSALGRASGSTSTSGFSAGMRHDF